MVLGDLRAAEDALIPVIDTPAAHRVRPLVHRVTEVGAMANHDTGHSDRTAQRIRAAVAGITKDASTRELTT